MAPRTLSYSEIQMALTCEAQWDFAYGGHLTGGVTLRPKQLAAKLSAGRAWGAGVAVWHQSGDLFAAHQALLAAYALDVKAQLERGITVSLDAELALLCELQGALDHYVQTASRLENVTRLEHLLESPIPSRTGVRSSTRYHFEGYVDAVSTDADDNEWLVEFKWRQPVGVAQLQLSRQVRDYAWARQRQTGRRVVGVIFDERVPAAPRPPRIVKGPRPSHDREQLCTAPDYLQACSEFGVKPWPATVAALEARVWHARSPITFGLRELEETGRELVSAARLIADLDSGRRYPIRNAQPRLCRSCRFLSACPAPQDRLFLETMFELRPPKRERDQERKTDEQARHSARPRERLALFDAGGRCTA